MAKRKYFLNVPPDYYDGRTAECFNKCAMRGDMFFLYFRMIHEAAPNNGRLFLNGEKYSTLDGQLADAFQETHRVIQAALTVLFENNIISREEGGGIFFPECNLLTRSESVSTERVRRYRKRKDTYRRRSKNEAIIHTEPSSEQRSQPSSRPKYNE